MNWGLLFYHPRIYMFGVLGKRSLPLFICYKRGLWCEALLLARRITGFSAANSSEITAFRKITGFPPGISGQFRQTEHFGQN
jgi:hypothetical protein